MPAIPLRTLHSATRPQVIELLEARRDAGAEEQVAVLAGRLAAHASFDNPSAPVLLLEILRRVGTEEQFGAFVHRLPAEGRFDLFRQEADYYARYRFGRESDGSPAPHGVGTTWTDGSAVKTPGSVSARRRAARRRPGRGTAGWVVPAGG